MELPDHPEVGLIVCDCRGRHVRVTAVDPDEDTVTTEDGWQCSWFHCCSPADHDEDSHGFAVTG